MDYESLIADLQKISQMNSISHYKRDVCAAAATALSTLQAENKRLKNKLSELAHLPFNGPGIGERTRLMAENEKLRAELEQVKRERDAAVSDLKLFATCDTCKFGQMTMNYDCLGCDHTSNWQWHGPKEAEHD